MALGGWRPDRADCIRSAPRPSLRLLPTATWLVIRRFGETFLGALATFVVLDLLASFIDKFDDLMAYGLLRPAGIEYLLLKLPLMTAQLMPVACLAGVLLGLGMLNRNGELLALQGLGISRVGIALPLLLISALISVAAFGLNETIVPAATRRSKYLLNNVIQKQPQFVYTAQNWLRTRDSFVAVKRYDPLHKRLIGVRIFQIGPHYDLHAIYSADTADWNGKDWIFSGLKVLNISHQGARAWQRGNFTLMPSLAISLSRFSVPRNSVFPSSMLISRSCAATAWILAPTSWTAT